MKNVLLLFSSTRNLKLLVVSDLPKAIIGRAVFSDLPSLGGTKAYVIFTKADLSLYLFIGSFETVNCCFLILTFQFNRNRDKGTQLLQNSGLCKLQIQGGMNMDFDRYHRALDPNLVLLFIYSLYFLKLFCSVTADTKCYFILVLVVQHSG